MREELDRDDVIRELRRVAATLDRAVTRQDLSTPAFWGVLRWFGSIAKAREEVGLAQPDRNIRWNKQKVIDEIRGLSRKGIVITRSELRATGRHDLIGAITFHIGSILRARRLARVPDPTYRPQDRQRWNEDRVVDEIKQLRRAGKSLAPSKAPSALVRAAIYYYGSWRGAVEVAGFDYSKVRLVREPFSEKELLERLRALARKRPDLTAGELAHLSWREALVNHFGSLDEAVRRAGIEDWPVRLRQPALSRDGVIAALRARRRAGKPSFMRAVMLDDNRLFHSVLVHFADWPSAIAAAKLRSDSPQTNKWTNESIIAAIQARHERGASLRKADVQREDSTLLHSAAVRFRGWAGAIRAAGISVPWALTRWTRERVVDELRRAAAGRDHVTVDEAGNKLVTAAQRHFGSFTGACRAAGLSTEYGMAYVAARIRRRS